MSRTFRSSKHWLKQHDAENMAEDLDIERRAELQLVGDRGTAAFHVARLSGAVVLRPRHGLHNLHITARKIVEDFLLVPDTTASTFDDVECIYVYSDDSDDPEDGGGSGQHSFKDGTFSARSTTTPDGVLPSSSTGSSRTGSKSRIVDATALPLLDIGIGNKLDTDVSSLFGKGRSGSPSDEITIAPVIPCITTTPSLYSSPPKCTGVFTCALSVDLTQALESVLGKSFSRIYCSSRAYADAEWKVVEDLLFTKCRESSIFDCFWSWRRHRAVPAMHGVSGNKNSRFR